MGDVVYLLVLLGFFVLCALYVWGCARIVDRARPAEEPGEDARDKAVR
jgi:hypothetical protein